MTDRSSSFGSRLFLSAIILLALCGVARAADTLNLTWSPSPGATSYLVQQSIDDGVTRSGLATVTACAAICTYTATVQSSGLVLIRFVAVNAAGQGIRYESGIWHNGAFAVPTQPTVLGVQ